MGFFGELSDEILSKKVRTYIVDTLSYETQNLMSIMETNDGRNKIFGLVQYILVLYTKSMTS